MKHMTTQDTSSSSYTSYFRKLENDTLYPSAFHYEEHHEGEYSREVLYTGNEFVSYSKKDSTGEIMSNSKWAEDIQSFSHNHILFSPFTSYDGFPLPHDSLFLDTNNQFEFIKNTVVNDLPCYHVRRITIPDDDSSTMIKQLRVEYNFWINKRDYIPVKYTSSIDLVLNGDTMNQFREVSLTKYKVNYLTPDDQHLSLEIIPSFIKLGDYQPYESPELLSIDSSAPEWSLLTLNDDTLNLSDLKGEVVLLDFFYKSCYPCMLALPFLQELHEKYNDKGLKVIGIDPYDTKEDDIEEFLSKRGVSYTVVLDNKDTAGKYHVSGYPTIYLINKEGKIVHTQVGYSEEIEDELEEIIRKELDF